nr:inactive protein kinase SELMODRAFT_444075-like isoform X1 [Ipomoea batatas]
MLPPKSDLRANSMPRVVTPSEKVIVAVKAEKVITKAALAWALTHVVRPGDCITLLAVYSERKTERKSFWGFRKLKGDCRSGDRVNSSPDRICQITDSCSQMVLQFNDQIDVRVRIKVVSANFAGAVAAEAKSNAASWVILDKKLKQERKFCVEELHCNIVVMKGSQPKVLRLNLGCSDEPQTPYVSAEASPVLDNRNSYGHRMKHSTPVSSPEDQSPLYMRTPVENFTRQDSFLLYQHNPLYEGPNKAKFFSAHKDNEYDGQLNAMDSVGERIITLSSFQKSETESRERIFWIPQNHIIDKNLSTVESQINTSGKDKNTITSRNEHDNFSPHNQGLMRRDQNFEIDFVNSSIREAVSLGRTSSKPPPLCSICQLKAPSFGKPPRQFLYEELEEATDGFSDTNFLAEGGFGLVHKGILRDGLVVAVKQLKFLGSQADTDFCREVQVLSCAQQVNSVFLVIFAIQPTCQLLTVSYHNTIKMFQRMTGKNRTTLDWHSRLKIAIGTARGLRYLHEDCRVGCIVHRDLRPKNILLTHDFEPLVTDFGLARLHSEWVFSDDKHLLGTSEYLAPEFFTDGKVTEKVDIYAFGLVLLELITGKKTSDFLYYKGQSLLLENSYPSATVEPIHILAHKHQLLDSNLASTQLHNLPRELQAMGFAASLCLQREPDLRPPMSKVLRVLEGGATVLPLDLDSNLVSNRSSQMQGVNISSRPEPRRHSRRLSY